MKRLGPIHGAALRVAMSVPRGVPRRRTAYPRMPSTVHVVRGCFVALLLSVCLTFALFLPGVVARPAIHAGDVAQSTILAPSDFSFVDTVATVARRAQAAAGVQTQYRTSTEAQVQSESVLTAILSAIPGLQKQVLNKGRHGDQATTLIRLSQGAVSQKLAQQLLGLSAQQLARVQNLALNALQLTSRQPLPPSQVPILQGVSPFPVTVPPGLERDLAGQLYAAFLKPNRIADSTQTLKAQQAAVAAVAPVEVTYRHNQVIVRLGDVVTAGELTALQAAGLANSGTSWQELAACFLISIVAAGLLHGYLISIQSPILVRPRRLILLNTLLLSTVTAAVFTLQGHGLLPFIFPSATLSMLLAVLLNAEVSVVATAAWAVLAGWLVGGSFEIATYYLVTGVTSALLVRSVRRSSDFFVAGFSAAGAGFVTILAFKLLHQGYDWLGLSTYTVGVLVSGGLAAALTIGGLSGLGRLFGVTTGLHLLELSHPNHPLLRRLMQEAPGTYHHSMMIGTLAERAAEQIGADPLLVRVVAYFHDIGKLVSPPSFAENQAGIENVHEQLEPKQSVELILQHVYEGVRLARQYHLPEVLEDGIWQHHGTNMVSFFYQQAVAMYGADMVRVEEYRYPGPKPQSCEMAILMLADGVEAAVRSSPGIDADQIRAIIHRIAQERLHDGQFDECNLTLRDLAVIQESFATVLQGFSHPRVQYPAPVPAVLNG